VVVVARRNVSASAEGRALCATDCMPKSRDVLVTYLFLGKHSGLCTSNSRISQHNNKGRSTGQGWLRMRLHTHTPFSLLASNSLELVHSCAELVKLNGFSSLRTKDRLGTERSYAGGAEGCRTGSRFHHCESHASMHVVGYSQASNPTGATGAPFVWV
jgi:hypothetical protein